MWRALNFFFLSFRPKKSWESDLSVILTMSQSTLKSHLKIIQSHDTSTLNYIQKSKNKNKIFCCFFYFVNLAFKPVKRDIFVFPFFLSLRGTNSFSVLCTHLIDFKAASRLRYECFFTSHLRLLCFNKKLNVFRKKWATRIAREENRKSRARNKSCSSSRRRKWKNGLWKVVKMFSWFVDFQIDTELLSY